MAWPPLLPPQGRSNTTPQLTNHPDDHNRVAIALTTLVNVGSGAGRVLRLFQNTDTSQIQWNVGAALPVFTEAGCVVLDGVAYGGFAGSSAVELFIDAYTNDVAGPAGGAWITNGRIVAAPQAQWVPLDFPSGLVAPVAAGGRPSLFVRGNRHSGNSGWWMTALLTAWFLPGATIPATPVAIPAPLPGTSEVPG